MLSTIKNPQHRPLLIALLIAGGLAMVAVFEPAGLGLPWDCRLNQITGLYCPGCGATRATQSLLRGDLHLAAQQNALWILFLAVAVLYGLTAVLRRRHAPALPRVPAWLWWSFGLVTIIFFVMRNLPGESFAYLRPPG